MRRKFPLGYAEISIKQNASCDDSTASWDGLEGSDQAMEFERQKFSHRMFNTVVISWGKQLFVLLTEESSDILEQVTS